MGSHSANPATPVARAHVTRSAPAPVTAMLLFVLSFLLLMPAPAVAQMQGPSILVVARETLRDPRFSQTVVLVTRHGRSPPLGVIINRPTEALLGKLFPALPDEEAARPLHFGGPIATGDVSFLYRDHKGSADAITVAPGIHLGRSGQTLRQLLRSERSHSGLKVFAGYSGWGFGQLESEIARGDWYVLPVDAKFIFDQPAEVIWPELYRRAAITSVSLPPNENNAKRDSMDAALPKPLLNPPFQLTSRPPSP